MKQSAFKWTATKIASSSVGKTVSDIVQTGVYYCVPDISKSDLYKKAEEHAKTGYQAILAQGKKSWDIPHHSRSLPPR